MAATASTTSRPTAPDTTAPRSEAMPVAVRNPTMGPAQQAAQAAAPAPSTPIPALGSGVSMSSGCGAEEAGEHALAVGWGVDVEGDAATVDDQGEVEEPAAALFGGGEPGDLRDVGVGPELKTQAAVDAMAGGHALEQRVPLAEARRHLAGAERARDRHVAVRMDGSVGGVGVGDERHRRGGGGRRGVG